LLQLARKIGRISAAKLISSLAAGEPLDGVAGGVLEGFGAAADGVLCGVVGAVVGAVAAGVDGVLGAVVEGVFAGVLGAVVDGVLAGAVFDDDGLVGASSIEPLQPSARVLAASQARPNVVRSAIGEAGEQDCRLKGTSHRAMAEIWMDLGGFVLARLRRARPSPCRLLVTCAESVLSSCRNVRGVCFRSGARCRSKIRVTRWSYREIRHK